MREFTFYIILLLTSIHSSGQFIKEDVEKTFSKSQFPTIRLNNFSHDNPFKNLLVHKYHYLKSYSDFNGIIKEQKFIPGIQSFVPNNVQLEWIKEYGLEHAPSNDAGCAITSDADGNFYVSGITNTSKTGYDIFLIKYGNSGDSLWSTSYTRDSIGSTEYPVGIALDLNGNIYITGISVTTSTKDDYITLKYNANGQLEWVQFYNCISNDYDQPSDIAIDIEGNVYVTGRSYSTATSFDILTIKYRSDGTIAWIRRYNNLPTNGDDGGSSIYVDQSLNVFIAGGSDGTSTDRDFIILEYDSLGEIKLETRYDANHRWDFAWDIVLDDSKNVYVTGVSDSLNDEGDFLTIKYDSTGNILWKSRYNGSGSKADEAVAIVVDPSHDVYITGYSYGGVSTHNDIVTIKYNSSGLQQWIDRYDGEKSSGDYPHEIKRDMYGNIYICGSSYQGGYWNFPDEYTVIKYSNTGTRLWVKNYDNTDTEGECYAMSLDPLGNICVTGWIEDTLMNSNSITIKYFPSGYIEWVNSYDGIGRSGEGFSDMVIDSDGKIYVVGETYSKSSRHDFLILKFNTEGEIENTFIYNGPANATDIPSKAAIDSKGNIYVTGRSVGSDGSEDITTIKINNTGLEWVKRYSGPANKDDGGKSIILDHEGNVIVAGSSFESSSNVDIVTIKYDSVGNQLWVAKYDGPGNDDADFVTAIAIDYESNIYVLGRSLNSVSSDDYVTIKYYPDGAEAWIKRYDYNYFSDNPIDLMVDENKNVIVTGFSGIAGIEPYENLSFLGKNYIDSTTSFLTIKYDSIGNVLWIDRYYYPGSSDNRPNDLTIDDKNNIYITGICAKPDMGYDYLTVKYNRDGNLLWVKTYDGRNSNDQAMSITVDGYENAYITGSSWLPDNNSYDIVTIKYNSEGMPEWVDIYSKNYYRSDDVGLSIKTTSKGEVFIGGLSGGGGSSVVTVLKYNQDKVLPLVIQQGWNMLSIPLIVDDYRKTALFPTATSPAWTYQPEVGAGYIEKDTLKNGIGYWLKFSGDQLVEITGFPYPFDTIDLDEGWNMIGSLSEPVDVNSIMFIPGDITRSDFFGYHGGYFVTDTIQPGRGYWVRVSQPVKMILSAVGGLNTTSQIKFYSQIETPPPPPGDDTGIKKEIPTHFTLEQNYPNPFNPMTMIKFDIPKEVKVTLKMYNMLGAEVETLIDEVMEPGYYNYEWNASRFASGVYFYRITAGNYISIKKLILLR